MRGIRAEEVPGSLLGVAAFAALEQGLDVQGFGLGRERRGAKRRSC